MQPLVSSFVSWWIGWWKNFQQQFYIAFIKDDRWTYITTGLKNTLIVTLFAVLLGIAVGAVIAIIRSTWDKNRETMRPGPGKALLWLFNALSKVYLTIIRGTPVVVQIMILFFVIMASSNNKILVGVIAFGLNSAAYVAEIIRSGIMSIDVGQTEAGRSLGFNYPQTMWYIVLPQALKNVLPALANEFIVLLKETAVAGYVGLTDLTRGVNIIRGVTYQSFLPLMAAAVIYLIMVIFFTWLVSRLERRLRDSEH